MTKWIKENWKKKVFNFFQAIIVITILWLVLYALGRIGGSGDYCPEGTHEESRYGLFGGEECVSDY